MVLLLLLPPFIDLKLLIDDKIFWLDIISFGEGYRLSGFTMFI